MKNGDKYSNQNENSITDEICIINPIVKDKSNIINKSDFKSDSEKRIIIVKPKNDSLIVSDSQHTSKSKINCRVDEKKAKLVSKETTIEDTLVADDLKSTKKLNKKYININSNSIKTDESKITAKSQKSSKPKTNDLSVDTNTKITKKTIVANNTKTSRNKPKTTLKVKHTSRSDSNNDLTNSSGSNSKSKPSKPENSKYDKITQKVKDMYDVDINIIDDDSDNIFIETASFNKNKSIEHKYNTSDDNSYNELLYESYEDDHSDDLSEDMDNDDLNEILHDDDSKIELKEGVSKKCSTCGKVKLLCMFHKRTPKNGRYSDGHSYHCKGCVKKYNKKWRDKNKEHISKYNKKYKEDHPDIIQSYNLTKEQKTKNIKTRRDKYFCKFKEIIEQNGGSCIGTADDYITAHTQIKVKCVDGHEWHLSLNNAIKNKWCPKCKTNLGELIALASCIYLFDKPFTKVRPLWLVNDDGNRLELDMYNDDLKLAVEYNGIQHYKFIEFFCQTIEGFNKRVKDDKIKIDICKKQGVHLIVVPYTIPIDKICKYIFDEANKLELVTVNKVKEFDLGELRPIISNTEQVRKIITDRNGELLEGICFDNHSRLVIKCHKGHIWQTLVKYIRNNSWCHTCYREKSEDTKQKTSESMKKFKNTDEGKESTKQGHINRSKTMNAIKETDRANITEKTCKGKYGCDKTKPVSEFDLKEDAHDGYQTYCKECTKKMKNKYRAEKKKEEQASGIRYQCTQCPKSFALKDSLTRHIREKHPAK